jgi:small nuclear ribonucleoprotein (snRNP)-like protein
MSGGRKESILELSKMMDAVVKVKCLGGRELQGTLRGYDDLVNLVLDDCEEFLRGACTCKGERNAGREKESPLLYLAVSRVTFGRSERREG